MSDKGEVKPVEQSEELFTTQDLLTDEPIAIATDELEGLEFEEDRDEDIREAQEEDDQVGDNEAYETDEELLAENENFEPAEEDDAAEDVLEQMEEDSELTETSKATEPGAKAKSKGASQNRFPGLPLSKVKHIIKLDPEVKLVNSEAVYLVTRATEFFIRSLAKEAHNHAAQQKKKTLTKSHVDQALAMLPIEL